jgi:hypothetical protein
MSEFTQHEIVHLVACVDLAIADTDMTAHEHRDVQALRAKLLGMYVADESHPAVCSRCETGLDDPPEYDPAEETADQARGDIERDEARA